MDDLYRLTELGKEQAEPLDGLVQYVVSGIELVELIRRTIIDRKSFDTARQIGETVVRALTEEAE